MILEGDLKTKTIRNKQKAYWSVQCVMLLIAAITFCNTSNVFASNSIKKANLIKADSTIGNGNSDSLTVANVGTKRKVLKNGYTISSNTKEVNTMVLQTLKSATKNSDSASILEIEIKLLTQGDADGVVKIFEQIQGEFPNAEISTIVNPDFLLNKSTSKTYEKDGKPNKINVTITKVDFTDPIKETDTLNTLNDSLLQNIPDTLVVETTDTIKPEKNDRTITSLQFIAGGMRVNSRLSINDEFNTIRKESESGFTSIDLTLMINRTKKNLVYGAGLNYQVWGENYNYLLEVPSTKTIQNLIGSNQIYEYTVQEDSVGHINGTGDFVLDSINYIYDTVVTLTPVYNDTVVDIIDSVEASGVNRYHTISVPFSIGYKFVKNRLSVTPKVSGIVSIPINSTGKYIDDISSSQLTEYNLKRMFFLMDFSIDISYKVKGFTYSIIPIHRRALMPFVDSKNINHYYYGSGIELGIAYEFK